MPRNDANDIIKAIDHRIQVGVQPSFSVASVVGIPSQGLARIQLRGSGANKTASLANHMRGVIQIGDEVIVVRASEQDAWIVIAGTGTENRQETYRSTMLAPPANLATVKLPGAILVKWDAPVHAITSFQIQHNASESETGASTIFVAGTQYLYVPEEAVITDTRYFRIRTVSSSLAAPALSTWLF